MGLLITKVKLFGGIFRSSRMVCMLIDLNSRYAWFVVFTVFVDNGVEFENIEKEVGVRCLSFRLSCLSELVLLRVKLERLKTSKVWSEIMAEFLQIDRSEVDGGMLICVVLLLRWTIGRASPASPDTFCLA